MATLAQTLPETTMRVEPRPAPRPRVVSGAAPVLLPWLRAQSINVTRHAAALRPFKRDEFGPGQAAPSEGHIQVVNDLITNLRRGLLKMSKNVHDSIAVASEDPRSHRPASGQIWRLVAELRSHRDGLLSGRLHQSWRSQVRARAPTILLHENGVRACNHQTRHSYAQVGEAIESFSPGTAAIPSSGKSVDARGGDARS